MSDNEKEILRDTGAAVEVARFETVCGPRLRIRDLAEGTEIYLDPLELEGLTRASGNDRLGFGEGIEMAWSDDRLEGGSAETLRNEFAMVQVGLLGLEPEVRLRIRDLASQIEVLIAPRQLQQLTHFKHHELASLLDPSEFVAATEPDPDQV